MDINLKRMNEDYAKEILLWKYDAPYDFYNNELNEEGLKELLNGFYVVLVDEKERLVGFFCTGISAQVPEGIQFEAYSEGMVDIGLGMKPELTGNGFGTEFFTFILSSIQELQEKVIPLRLTVASFNKRAIYLYKKFGFIEGITFRSNDTEFTTMVKI